MKTNFWLAAFGLILTSCSDRTEEKIAVTKTADTLITTPAKIVTEPEGIVGVMNIPEVLTLAIKDSGNMEEVPFKVGKAYSAIEADLQALNLNDKNSIPGAIYYNNDVKNLVFECVIPIAKMPATQPKHSTIVILEATRAVVYNYYGPYDKLNTAYEKLKVYLQDNKLVQTGPAREFYVSDTEQEKDPSKWLSKIYIPVK